MTPALASYLDLLFGAEPEGAFAELRFKLRSGGMGQDLVPVGNRERLQALIQARGASTALYLGAAPRARQEGTRESVERLHALWADVDSPEAVSALKRFEPKPSMVIASGGPGRFHAYWALLSPVTPNEAERANKKLIAALEADERAYDAARILRPPATFNFKTSAPRPVTVESLNFEAHTVEQVVGHLADPEPERPPRVSTIADRGARADDPLLGVHPVTYVEALTGQEVGRDGKIACPSMRCVWDHVNVEAHHVLPLARGGTNSPANGVPLCRAHHREAARA